MKKVRQSKYFSSSKTVFLINFVILLLSGRRSCLEDRRLPGARDCSFLQENLTPKSFSYWAYLAW